MKEKKEVESKGDILRILGFIGMAIFSIRGMIAIYVRDKDFGFTLMFASLLCVIAIFTTVPKNERKKYLKGVILFHLILVLIFGIISSL